MSVVSANGAAVIQSPNYIINGAFDIWQRGTTFTATGFSADRWVSPNTSTTLTQETSDLPTGFQYGAKFTPTAAGQFAQWNQGLETANVIQLRGQIVTVSGWIKISGPYSGTWVSQAFYSTTSDAYASQTTLVPGSSKSVATIATNTWTRWTNTFLIPSNAVGLRIENIPDSVQAVGVTVRVTGIQLELGSAATPFRRNSSTVQAELAACQRYFERVGSMSSSNGAPLGTGIGISSTQVRCIIRSSVPKRVGPTITYNAGTAIRMWDGTNLTGTVTGVAQYSAATALSGDCLVDVTTTGSVTQYRPYFIIPSNDFTGTFDLNSEL